MAIDQYGKTEHLGWTKYPRQALMDKCYSKHAQRMFQDGKDGKTYHTGYIISGRWFNLYEVVPVRKEI